MSPLSWASLFWMCIREGPSQSLQTSGDIYHVEEDWVNDKKEEKWCRVGALRRTARSYGSALPLSHSSFSDGALRSSSYVLFVLDVL